MFRAEARLAGTVFVVLHSVSPAAQVRKSSSRGSQGLLISLDRMDGRGFARTCGQLTPEVSRSFDGHTLVFCGDRVFVDLVSRAADQALTPSCVLSLSSRHSGGVHNVFGLVDLMGAGPAELDDLAKQISEMVVPRVRIFGSVLVRAESGEVFWSSVPVSAVRGLSGSLLRRFLVSRAVVPGPVYSALSSLIDPLVRDKWRPYVALAGERMAAAVSSELGLSEEFALYVQGLGDCDPNVPVAVFYAAEFPLQVSPELLDDDVVQVMFAKGYGDTIYRWETFYVPPLGCPDPAAWGVLRGEGNSVEEATRIISMV